MTRRQQAWVVIVAWVLCASPAIRAGAEDTASLLQAAIRVRLSVSYSIREGVAIPAAHCRHANEGCERRLGEFAQYLVNAGNAHSVDPWLLAAMASRESGFNPFAQGAVGELGLLQIHPRSKAAREVRFVQDEWYRKRCRRQPGACQEEVVQRAAQLFAACLERCEGDVSAALGAYNTGRCSGNVRYSRLVLEERTRLRRSVGLDAPASARTDPALGRRRG